MWMTSRVAFNYEESDRENCFDTRTAKNRMAIPAESGSQRFLFEAAQFARVQDGLQNLAFGSHRHRFQQFIDEPFFSGAQSRRVSRGSPAHVKRSERSAGAFSK